MGFQKGSGDWKKYRELGTYTECDFHYLEGRNYSEKLGQVHGIVMGGFKEAQEKGIEYVIFTHGHSTSGPFKTTTRSIVRHIMRSKESTPYVIKKNCIQHYSVFVAAIRPISKKRKGKSLEK